VLAQGIIPALNVMGLPGLFIHRLVLIIRNNAWVGVPEITITDRLLIRGRNSRPQEKARRFISITDGVSDHFTSVTTQSNPDPNFVRFTKDKGP